MADCIILRSGGGKKYVWDKYTCTFVTNYTWNRYDVIEEYVYNWNKYSVSGSGTVKAAASAYSRWIEVGEPRVYRSAIAGGPDVSDIIFSGLVSVTESNIDNLVGYYHDNAIFQFKKLLISSDENESGAYAGQAKYQCSQLSVSWTEEKGSFIGTVTSSSSTTYPNNGVSGSYWYAYTGRTTVYSKGTSAGTVTSSNRSEYPDDDVSGSYWYTYSSSSSSYLQGDYIESIKSDDRNTYPDNNYQGDYWYVYQGETRGAGALRRILAG